MNIAEFYDADPRRRESEELVFGDGWTSAHDKHATYRVSWVQETGEVYAVREPHPGGILARYLDELHVDQADVSDLQVEVLGTLTQEQADDALDAWPKAMHGDDSLAWARERVAEEPQA